MPTQMLCSSRNGSDNSHEKARTEKPMNSQPIPAERLNSFESLCKRDAVKEMDMLGQGASATLWKVEREMGVELVAEVRRLTAQLAEARKDVARVDWLEDNGGETRSYVSIEYGAYRTWEGADETIEGKTIRGLLDKCIRLYGPAELRADKREGV